MSQRPDRVILLQHQIQRIESRLLPLQQRSNQFSWLRLIVFLIGVVASVATLWLVNPWIFAVTLFAAVVLLLFVVYKHNQLDQAIAQFEMMQQIKQEQIARATIDWVHLPTAQPVDISVDHPFAADLDITGDFSLHRLLDCAATQAGSQRLVDWLTAQLVDAKAIRHRQQLVREFIPRQLWRDRLSMVARLGTEKRQRYNPNQLLLWLKEQKEASLNPGIILSLVLLAATAFLGLLSLLGITAGWWQYSYLTYFVLQLYFGRTTGESFTQAATLQDGLERLMAVMHHIEKARLGNAANLRQLCMPVTESERRPSLLLRRLRQTVAATAIQSNPVVALLCNAFFPWNLFFASRLQVIKKDLSQHLPQWLEIWYSLEALNSLATFAWLHPQAQFADIASEDASFTLKTRQIGHPLIRAEAKVRNDFEIDQLGDLALITGSNMAGKSTFLRALGLNLLLAFAGSVIDGESLVTSPLRLFTSIKISDSVTQGVSFFYAEVKRLKRLLDELERTDSLPLFFCIDEIFRGTNNRERLIGSRSYIRRLVGKHGVGLISTHDLELVKLAEELPQITNYHFRDEIVAGSMVFDYKLHPGPCPTTNALEVMRNAGLPVDS